MKKLFLIPILLLISIFQLVAAESSPQFIKGTDTLVVYRSIPNLPEFMPKVEASEKQDIRTFSDKFTIRVRSAASNNEWVDVLALYTYNRAVEILDLPQTNGTNSSTSVQNYPNATAGWSHSYGNIEMSRNQPVEVEISLKPGVKIDGREIYKATVHPAQKASAAVVVGGKVYFTLRNPAQVAIDINGQMDDHNPFNGSPVGPPTDGVSTYTVPIHTITLFANPVIKKPALNDARTFYVVDGKMPTAVSPSTYDVLYFMPGVHNMGLNNKIYPGKSIYIPGDAIIFGSINNAGVPIPAGFTKIGERIKIFGYGTISGARTKHPSYDLVSGIHEPVNIENALNYQVSGITITDPAHFSLWTPGGGGGLVTYVKVIGWRANGDGLGNGDNVNDCFVRTNDDESYVRGNRKRVTYWKDNISAIFYMAQIWTSPVLIEDCDVLYCRARGGGGAAWDMRADQTPGVKSTQTTFRNIRFHDPKANMVIFNLVTFKGSAAAPTEVGQSYNWIKFENISIKSSAVKSNLLGCAASPWNGGLTFDNVSFAGTTLTQANLNTYFNTNEYVNSMVFGTPVNYTITLNVSGGGGTVSGGGTFNPSNTATIAAKSAAGYIFDNWTEGATVISSDSIYSFNVLASRTLTANFIPFSGAKYTIAASANNSSSGTISGDGVYRDGQLISVSATANSCNEFINWTENIAIVSTDANYSFKVAGNRNLIANFSPKSFTVNNVTPEGGTVTGDLTYNCNQTINLTATPNTNYKFDGWYANDTLISTNTVASINTGNARLIKAKFLATNIIPQLTGWVSGATNNKAAGNNRLMVVMVMGEHATSDYSATNVTYGGQTMTKITERIHGTTYRTYAAIFTLNEQGVNDATSGTIDVVWSSAPGGSNIYSVLLGNVDQTTPVSSFANNSLDGTSITTSDLTAANGDLIIMGGATANNTTITFNNGFANLFESNATWGDGIGGSKQGTGVAETPGFTQSASGRMVLCAMVVKKSAITSINEVADAKFNIYPNPATDKLFFNSAEKMVDKIQLVDLTGKIVYADNVRLNNGSIDLKGIAKGMYLVKIQSDNYIITKKISIK